MGLSHFIKRKTTVFFKGPNIARIGFCDVSFVLR